MLWHRGHLKYSPGGVRGRASEGKALENHQAVVSPDIVTMIMTNPGEKVLTSDWANKLVKK